MSLRGTLIAVAVVLLGALAASSAAQGQGSGVNVPGVGEADVPSVPDLPQVPGLPETPNVGSTVDDVIDQVPVAKDVVPDLGPDEAPQPSPSEPAPAEPAPSPPADAPAGGTVDGGGSGADGAPAADVPAGASGDGQGGGGRDGTGGARADAGAGPDAGAGTAPAGSGEAAGEAAIARRTAGESDSNLPSRIGEFIAGLPTGVLIGLFGLSVIALLMTGRSAWFARATRRLRLQRHSLERDVGALQAALVPELPEAIGGVGVSVAYRPAAGPAAGGDFHDVFELADGRIGIVIGDVAGHGREALPRTGVMRYTIRAYLEAGLEPRVAIRLTDRALGGNFDGDFASALAATYEPATRRLIYSCAGHPQPIVVGGDPAAEVDVLAAPPIGIGHPSGSRQTTLALDPGSELWLFTDGLIEARDEDGMLGRSGLRSLLAGRPDAAELLERLPGVEARDDLTVVRLQPPEFAQPPQPFGVEALLVEHSYEEDEIARFLDACGLDGEELAEVCTKVAEERRREGQVLIRISRLDSVLHWRVERVESHLGRTVPAVDGATASPLAG